MDKSFLQNTLKFFSDFGDIKSRSMFGGFGIFCNDTMFALVVNDALHLRATSHNEAQFKAFGMEPYRYSKRGFPVVTKYFAIPESWWQQSEMLLEQAKQVLDIAVDENKAKKSSQPSRIKDLPNLRLTTERLLKKAGIDSVEKLHREGALGAFKALQRAQNGTVSLDLLWALEGALSGTHWTVIPPKRRNELLENLR
ncbi:MAG: TfoX/Sxy family DNA transformation protein [Enterovibrio sp.]